MLIDIEDDVMNTPEEQVEILQKNLHKFHKQAVALWTRTFMPSLISTMGSLIERKKCKRKIQHIYKKCPTYEKIKS